LHFSGWWQTICKSLVCEWLLTALKQTLHWKKQTGEAREAIGEIKIAGKWKGA